MKKQLHANVESTKLVKPLLLIFCLFYAISGFGQTNIAPSATVSNSDPWNWTNINNQDTGTCGTQTAFVWTTTPPSATPGVDWMLWEWPNVESFDEIVFYHANNNSRSLTGGLLQYWDGTSWVNHHTFSNMPQQCKNTITFPRITSDKLRITALQMTGLNQQSNPNFREIEIWSAPTSNNDAGVAALVAPTAFCPGTEDIIVRVQNFGINQIDSVYLDWSVNSVPQTGMWITTLLDTIGGLNPIFTNVNLGPWAFAANTSYTIEAWTSLPNGQPDTINFNDTLTITIAPAISGTFTINAFAATSGTNFNNFTDFANFLNNNGICGPVVANVAPGTGPYMEQIQFNDIQGASATNTITINGNGNTLTFSSTSTSERSTLTLNGTDYMTIDSLYINAAGTFGWVVHLLNGADHNTFTNCQFETDANSTSLNFSNVVMSNSPTSATTAGNAGNYNTFDNNTHIGGYYGFAMNGASAASRCVGNTVTNSVFEDFYLYGMYLRSQDDMTISGNDISRSGRSTLSSFYGIYMLTGIGGSTVMDNRIHDNSNQNTTSTSLAYPIYMSGATGSANNINVLANNLIYNINNSGTIYGMYLVGAANTHWGIYHNTIVIDQPSSTTTSATRGIWVTGAQWDMDIMNNIFYIDRPSASPTFMYLSSAMPVTSIDNNVYYSPHSANMDFGFSNGAITTFSDWQSAGYDINGIETNPTFLGGMGLDYYRPTVGAVKAIGANVLSDVPTDIEGVARTTSPDPGAYQFDPLPCSGAYDFIVDTLFPGGAEISWTSVAGINEWQVEWDTCGFVPGSAMGNLDSVVTTNNNYVLSNLPMGMCVCVYIREKCISGGYGNWTGPIELCVPIEDDAEMLSVISPDQMVCGDSAMNVVVAIRNNGFNAITSMPITVEVTGDFNQTITFTYTGNLLENEVDTVTVGTLNSYFGGYVNVNAYTQLPNDQLTSNDSIQLDSLMIMPYEPVLDDAFICFGDDSVTFNALSIPGANYNWFDVPVGGTPFATSDAITVATGALPVYVEYNDLNDSLLTTTLAGNGQNGNMVDFVIHNTLNVYGFDMLPSSTSAAAGFEIYYKVGSYQGSEATAADWTLLETFTNQSVTIDVLHRLTLTTPLTLTGGLTYSFYLTRTDASVRYTSTSSEYSVYVSNNDMDILEGVGKSYPFGSTFRPRMWNGRIIYGSEACSDVRVEAIPIIEDTLDVDFDWATVSHTVDFVFTGKNANSVTWYFDTLGTAMGDSVSFQFPRTDSFQVCVVGENGCGSDSVCKWVWAENISVDEHSLAVSLEVFPNPNEGRFTLSFDQLKNSDITIELLDLSGKTIFLEHHKGFSGVYQKDFDRNDLSSGMYMLRINNRDGIITRRVVIGK
ncbi:MAG: T9SS type A sorting domain-containing protein [Cryomorphaceae bacterium]|nr:T9SS type A sorting domain-containing protein [Cryomorphaceae bacterium]